MAPLHQIVGGNYKPRDKARGLFQRSQCRINYVLVEYGGCKTAPKVKSCYLHEERREGYVIPRQGKLPDIPDALPEGLPVLQSHRHTLMWWLEDGESFNH